LAIAATYALDTGAEGTRPSHDVPAVPDRVTIPPRRHADEHVPRHVVTDGVDGVIEVGGGAGPAGVRIDGDEPRRVVFAHRADLVEPAGAAARIRCQGGVWAYRRSRRGERERARGRQ
jgi:hypothetical protein